MGIANRLVIGQFCADQHILRGGVKDAEREADANRVLNEFLLFPEELDRMKEDGHG